MRDSGDTCGRVRDSDVVRGLLPGALLPCLFAHHEHGDQVVVRELPSTLAEAFLLALCVAQCLLEALPLCAHVLLLFPQTLDLVGEWVLRQDVVHGARCCLHGVRVSGACGGCVLGQGVGVVGLCAGG